MHVYSAFSRLQRYVSGGGGGSSSGELCNLLPPPLLPPVVFSCSRNEGCIFVRASGERENFFDSNNGSWQFTKMFKTRAVQVGGKGGRALEVPQRAEEPTERRDPDRRHALSVPQGQEDWEAREAVDLERGCFSRPHGTPRCSAIGCFGARLDVRGGEGTAEGKQGWPTWRGGGGGGDRGGGRWQGSQADPGADARPGGGPAVQAR